MTSKTPSASFDPGDVEECLAPTGTPGDILLEHAGDFDFAPEGLAQIQAAVDAVRARSKCVPIDDLSHNTTPAGKLAGLLCPAKSTGF